MKSIYKPIGDLVERIDERNINGSINTLLGVSIDKCFIKSVANTVGTDLTKYKVIRRDDFAVSLMQVSRDAKIPVACLKDCDCAIMSPAYSIFRVVDTNEVLPDYLSMWFSRSEFDREAAFIAVGGVRGSMPWEEFCRIQVLVPSLEEQRKIVRDYQTVVDRIALKRKINDNLEAAMRALFEHFVVSNEAYDFDEAIDDKIDFINGLAMQNYRPEKDETPIPVIKIRELSQGYCDENSEFCSNHIDKSHIIQNGDLVFSWSGSLQASFWTSQTAGLNQHLFKVQSDEYPLWFVYEWVTFHLLNFQRIAENKGTTFGHIKREDLHNAKIKSVGIDEINKLNNLFQPLLNTIIANSTELHSLMNYQRVLLARLSR